MTGEGVYVSVSLETDQDWPVADIAYNGYQWASVTLAEGGLRITVYEGPGLTGQIPIDAAIAALQEAKRRLSTGSGDGAPDRP